MACSTLDKPRVKPGIRYELREGFRLPVDGPTVGREVERLKRAHGGRVIPAAVVEASRPDSAPLHPCFEWDDERAAELYREDQARHVIRSYYRVETAPDGAESRSIANVCVTVGEGDRERAYVSSFRAMSADDLRTQVIDEIVHMLRGVMARYRELPDPQGMLREAIGRLNLPE